MVVARTMEMPRSPGRDDVAVKVAAEIYRKAKMISAFRNIPMAEYLSNLLKKPVDADYEKLLKQMAGGSVPGSDKD